LATRLCSLRWQITIDRCGEKANSNRVLYSPVIIAKNRKLVFLQTRPHCIEGFRLPVCLSVTFRCIVQKNEHTIVRFSGSGRTIHLVSGGVQFIRIFAGDHHSEGDKVKHPLSLANILPIIGYMVTGSRRCDRMT